MSDARRSCLGCATKVLVSVVVLAIATVLVFRATPLPGAALVRLVFEHEAARVSQRLAPLVPLGIETLRDEVYDDGRQLALDVHRPQSAQGRALPTVVWIHGGAWVSGSKEEVAHYLQILAGEGFTTVAPDYVLAPRESYPAQLEQLDAALAYVLAHAERLGVDRERIFLAGDSAGAQMAAQLAHLVAIGDAAAVDTDPGEAVWLDWSTSPLGGMPALPRQALRGVVLFCGPYDFEQIRFDGPLGPALTNVAWSLFGSRDFAATPAFRAASVLHHVTSAFPPAFVSVGNADPLVSHSQQLVARLTELGVEVDALLFDAGHTPPLGHEYQFALTDADAQLAFDRMVGFLEAHAH
jgi:acetyl esterase/lipase